MKKFTLFLISFVFVFNLSLRADEGMWLLPLLEKLNMGKMTELGLELTAEEIYSINQSSLKDAIVIFGGGCTGEIVSDQGLLLTNHHCGYGRIQAHSTTEHNYLRDGFWAMSKEDELANPGLGVVFLVRIEDVSERVNTELNENMSEKERSQKAREVGGLIQKEATDGNHYTARVQSFFGGNNYYLLVYESYKDVRLVGAPPSSIGKYGHDTDNWEWPRHTGDFSVFRVYMSPDGKPAEYSEENIPLKPKHFLPVSNKGIKKDDFAMILGYPGGTQRYMTSYGIEEVLTITHPNRIKIRGLRQDILLEDMLADEKVRIQYASKFSGSSNYWKFSIGQSQGLERLNVKESKQKTEQQFTDWVNAGSQRKEKYGETLDLIKNSIDGRKEYTNATQYYSECLLRGSEIISFASRTTRLHKALEEENEENIQKAVASLKNSGPRFFKDYNAPTDRKVVKAMMKLFAEDVPLQYQPEIFNTIRTKYKGDYSKFVDKMFDKSIFDNETAFNAFLENPSLKVLDKDLAYQVATSTYEKYMELRKKSSEFGENLGKGRRLFIAGLREMDPTIVAYPDANFTMRLSYGSVNGYDPRDAVHYKYFTELKGVMEKEDPDNFEFEVDPKLKDLYNEKDYGPYGDGNIMPVCFLTNNDITGGNSGSPVINGKGELLGLAFDGNWEAMSGDIAFEPDLQRTIVVDIRYVLFIMDKLAGAKHLVDEMQVMD
ncbi:MAG: S46 family peptidase [Bacteroidales bacterium]|nr:S46 family peptidase [Bacteroidales bacterium]